MRYVIANGVKVPVLGLGPWDVFGAEGRRAMEEALELGCWHIDTAQIYGNEDRVGAPIHSSQIDRSEFFVVTKIDNANHGREATCRSIEKSLRRLETDFVDLLLIHWPSRTMPLTDTLETMAALRREGKVRTLGVNNFTTPSAVFAGVDPLRK